MTDRPSDRAIAKAFEVELAKLPAGAQQNIRDAMARGESLSWNMFRAGWLAAAPVADVSTLAKVIADEQYRIGMGYHETNAESVAHVVLEHLAAAPVAKAVYAVPTGQVSEGGHELYELHDQRVPLAEQQKLYEVAPAVEVDEVLAHVDHPDCNHCYSLAMDRALTRKTISDAIGFGFEDGELQTVNADDLLRLAAALSREGGGNG